MELDKTQVGKRLREFAKSKGGVGKLAESLDMSIQSLSGAYISGRNLPGAEVIAKLIALGCDINWLLTGSTQVVNVKTKDIKQSAQVIGLDNQVTITNIQGVSPQTDNEYQKLQQRYDYLWDELLKMKDELAKCKEQLKHTT
ncbi:MAG: helix-turn-helix domain-containing protein [Acidobacteriota bacterium]